MDNSEKLNISQVADRIRIITGGQNIDYKYIAEEIKKQLDTICPTAPNAYLKDISLK